jgi:hypothetical protein
VRRRAECTCLSPSSYAARFPLHCSTSCFGVRLHARGRFGFGSGCAAQRGVTRSWPGRPRRRRAAAAPRRMGNRLSTRPCSAASTCTADGGGDSAGALGRFAAIANGAPAAVLGVHVGVGIDEQSDDSAIAVGRRPVQRGVAIPVHGGAGVRGVGPTRVPQYPAGNRTQNSTQTPRVDYGFVLGRR